MDTFQKFVYVHTIFCELHLICYKTEKKFLIKESCCNSFWNGSRMPLVCFVWDFSFGYRWLCSIDSWCSPLANNHFRSVFTLNWNKCGFWSPSGFWSPGRFVVHMKTSQCVIVLQSARSRRPQLLPCCRLYRPCGFGKLTVLYLSFLTCKMEIKIVPTLCCYCKTYNICGCLLCDR